MKADRAAPASQSPVGVIVESSPTGLGVVPGSAGMVGVLPDPSMVGVAVTPGCVGVTPGAAADTAGEDTVDSAVPVALSAGLVPGESVVAGVPG